MRCIEQTVDGPIYQSTILDSVLIYGSKIQRSTSRVYHGSPRVCVLGCDDLTEAKRIMIAEGLGGVSNLQN
jgi:hypothetical protein